MAVYLFFMFWLSHFDENLRSRGVVEKQVCAAKRFPKRGVRIQKEKKEKKKLI